MSSSRGFTPKKNFHAKAQRGRKDAKKTINLIFASLRTSLRLCVKLLFSLRQDRFGENSEIHGDLGGLVSTVDDRAMVRQ